MLVQQRKSRMLLKQLVKSLLLNISNFGPLKNVYDPHLVLTEEGNEYGVRIIHIAYGAETVEQYKGQALWETYIYITTECLYKLQHLHKQKYGLALPVLKQYHLQPEYAVQCYLTTLTVPKSQTLFDQEQLIRQLSNKVWHNH